MKRHDRLFKALLLASALVVVTAGLPAKRSFAASAESESTAHLDLKAIFDNDRWMEFYSERQDLALGILRMRIGQVPKGAESDDVMRWVGDFAGRGFRKGQAEHFLFGGEQGGLRETFLDAVQKTDFRLSQDFLKRIYSECRSNPDGFEFQAFLQDPWVSFSAGLANDETYRSLADLLESRGAAASGDIQRYFKVLQYGYRTHAAHDGDFDASLRARVLESASLTVEMIAAVHDIMAGGEWDTLPSKKKWMYAKTASRLFNDFSVDQWGKAAPATVLDLAKTLSASGEGADYTGVGLTAWFEKIGSRIKELPADVPARSLMSYFIANSGLPLSETFRTVSPLFRGDQKMFVALHQSPPDPSAMGLWNEDAGNLTECIGLLTEFFQIARAAEWEAGLWECLTTHYYIPRSPDVKGQLFAKVMKPIYESQALEANPVRKRLLGETREPKSFLLDSHRYEIAHHLLENYPMTAMVAAEGGDAGVLTFSTDVYNRLRAEGPELYESESLKGAMRRGGTAAPHDEPDRIVAYINYVIGEPLSLMCYAFMGKTSRTRGVAFSLETSPEVKQFDELLRRIVQLKGDLASRYARSLGRIGVLDEVMNQIVREMEEAIRRKDEKQIISMIRLTLKITAVMEDDSYLDRILITLRKDVFGLGDDPALFVQLPPDELERKVAFFKLLNSEDLTGALEAIGKAKYFEKFYYQLYVPLRSIYGFFNRVGPEPYVRFMEEFAGKRRDAPVDAAELLKKEVESLGAIHDAAGRPAYINAEDAIAKLFSSPRFEGLSLNPWERPERWAPLNKNVNLGVVYRLLTDAPKESWRLENLPDKDRAFAYTALTRIFLEHLENPDRMDRPVELYGPPRQYSKWDFLTLLSSLVDLAEIHGYPFSGKTPSLLYEGSPLEGIKRRPLSDEANTIVPRQVDGTLRAAVTEKFKDLSGLTEEERMKRYEEVVRLALLLPNCEANNRGGGDDLERYGAFKEDVFKPVSLLLSSAAASSERLRALIWLCRLEASVYGLADEKKGLGYEEVRSKCWTSLGRSEQTTLRFEEFRLIQINQPNGKEASSLTEIAPIVQQLVEALARDYNLMDGLVNGRYDLTSQAILSLYKTTSPKNILEELKPDHVETLWFLTTKCADALADAAKRLELLNDGEKAAAADIISSLFIIHSYFMPYADSRFNVDAIFEAANALPVFCMLNQDVKGPAVRLLGVYKDYWSRSKGKVKMQPLELETFLICHNLLPTSLLEASLNDTSRFLALVEGKDIRVRSYNFHLLWEREDRATVSLEHLCREIMGGIDCNRDIIATSSTLTDEAYLEYFFGDMRRMFDRKTGFEGEMPQNFDCVVRRLVALPDDRRIDTLRGGLEARIREAKSSAKPEKDEKLIGRLEAALKDVDGLKDKIEKALSQGYGYFGKVLAEQFQSIFAIQKACEEAVAHAEAFSSGPPDALARYRRFYETALFDGSAVKGGGAFRPELEARMVKVFYDGCEKEKEPKERALAAYAEFDLLLEGTELKNAEGSPGMKTLGSAAMAARCAEGKSPLGARYVAATTRFLRCLFCGQHLEAGRPFIGDLLWGKDGQGAIVIKPLPYDDEKAQPRVRELLRWVYGNGKKYEGIPALRALFTGNSPGTEGGPSGAPAGTTMRPGQAAKEEKPA